MLVDEPMSHALRENDIPDTLQVHWPDFDDVSNLFTLQDTVSSTSGHTSHIQELRTVDHMIVCGLS